MRKLIATVLTAAALTLTAGIAYADPTAPTNGGSNNGGGQSGQCAGALADRPANCE